MTAYLALLRIDHWFKNIFVLPGVAVAVALLGEPALADGWGWRVVLALAATCIVASSNYVVNELLDAPLDRLHPQKRHRPAAAGRIRPGVALLMWPALGASGLALAAPLGWRAVASLAALWIMGVVYNVPPVRSKDVPLIDVLSESVNNPIRFLVGWYAVAPDGPLPPGSLLLAYWMVGAFLMAMKRLAEFRTLGPTVAAGYRRSFAFYTEERLMVVVLTTAVACGLFLGSFTVRYRLETALAFPPLAATLGWYLRLGLVHDSPVQRPEALWRQPVLVLLVTVVAAVGLLTLTVDMPWLADLLEPTAPTR